MIVAVSILSIAVFMVAYRVAGIYTITLDALASVRKATSVIRDDSLDDEQKEFLIKQSVIHLLKRFVQITTLGALILSLPIVLLLVFDALNIAQFQEVTNFLLRWEVVSVTTVGVVIISIIRR